MPTKSSIVVLFAAALLLFAAANVAVHWNFRSGRGANQRRSGLRTLAPRTGVTLEAPTGTVVIQGVGAAARGGSGQDDSWSAAFFHPDLEGEKVGVASYATVDFAPRDPKLAKRWKAWSVETNSQGPGAPVSSQPAVSPDTEEFPVPAVNLNEFACRLTTTRNFAAGQFRFVIASTGPVRIFIDDQLVESTWEHGHTGPEVTSRLVRFESPGPRRIRLEYAQRPFVHSDSVIGNVDIGSADEQWRDAAAHMRAAALHLHWVRDDFGLKVYVYQLPKRFNVGMMPANPPCTSHMFASDVRIHEALLDSVVRTHDPREADLFFVPVYSVCKMLGENKFGVNPWHGKRLTRESVAHVSQRYPFWKRSEGQDHVFAMTYDYGACFEYKYDKAQASSVVKEIRNSILLSIISDDTTPCFRAWQDVAVPTFVSNQALLAKPQKPDHRDWFAYFQGSIQWFDHDPDYSRGIRLQLHELYAKDDLIRIYEGKTPDYVDRLRRSIFCIAPLGFAVWSPRIYEAIIAGCIPVIIADGMRLPFSSELDWRTFSVMIPEARVRAGDLKKLLVSIPEARIHSKQAVLGRIHQSMIYRPQVPAEAPGGDAFGMIARQLRDRVRGGSGNSRSMTGRGAFWL